MFPKIPRDQQEVIIVDPDRVAGPVKLEDLPAEELIGFFVSLPFDRRILRENSSPPGRSRNLRNGGSGWRRGKRTPSKRFT